MKSILIAISVVAFVSFASADVAGLCDRSPAVVSAIENSIGRDCDEVTQKRLNSVVYLTVSKLESFKISDFRGMKSLERLKITSELPRITITKGFTKLLPALSFLQVTASEVVITPGAFENSTLTFLELWNAQLIEGSLSGLKAEIAVIANIPQRSLIENLEAEFATEDYACSATDADNEGHFNLACQKN